MTRRAMWCRAAVALFIALAPALLLLPYPALAAETADVAVTATPLSGVQPPTNFQAVLVDDNRVELSWVTGWGSTQTLVRMKVGSAPTSTTDGVQVYFGAATSANQTVALYDDETPIYFAAWGEDTGTYSATYVTDLVEALGMTLLAFVILAAGLTVAMFATRQMMLGYPAAMGWALLSGYAYLRSSTTWDVNYLLFFVSIGMVIFCALAMYGLKTKKERLESGDGNLDEEPDEPYYGEWTPRARYDEYGNERHVDDGDRDGGQDGDESDPDATQRTRAVRERAASRRELLRARAKARRERWQQGEL